MSSMIDVRVTHHGSLFILEPVSESAQDCCDEYLEDGQRWGVNGRVVEHRYIEDIIVGMQESGLCIKDGK